MTRPGVRARVASLWLDQTLAVKGLIAMTLPLLALLVSLAALLVVSGREVTAENEVRRTLRLQSDIESVSVQLERAATGVRGYLLTDDVRFLAPYLSARQNLPVILARLDGTVRDAGQRTRLERVRRLVGQKLAGLTELRDVQGSRADIIRQLVQNKVLLDMLRAELQAMTVREADLVAARTADSARVRQWRMLVLIGAALLGILGAAAGTLLYARSIVRRMQALREDARALALGQQPGPLASGRDEIAQLAVALRDTGVLLRSREDALREARLFLESLISSGPILMVRYDSARGTVSYLSPNAGRELGLPTLEAARPAALWARVDHATRALAARHAPLPPPGGTLLTRFRHGDGRPRWFQASLLPDGDELLVYALDVTEREEAARALLNSEERLRLAIEGVQEYGIFTLDAQGRVSSWNSGAQRIHGYDAPDILGRSLATFYPPGDRSAVQERLRTAQRDGRVADEGIRVRRDGSTFWASTVLTALHAPDGTLRGFSKITRDVTERHAAELAVRAAREEAERASRAKSEFLSRMSHELRTPLNAVLGFAQLLQLRAGDAQQTRYADQIVRAGRHLLGLINEVLDFSRLESGHLTLNPESLSVPDLLREVAELVGPSAQARQVTVVVPGGGPPEVYADRQRLTQVLLNLTDNAVKYNSPGGTAVLDASLAPDGTVTLGVHDSGPGLTPQQISDLFTPFDRLGAESGPTEGTGLGLAVSRHLVTAMHGHMTVDSTPGRGSTFRVHLPFPPFPLPAVQEAPHDP
ncbi:sensor histidine kinase [Deinococcus aquiradiocola]|uniref:histidine kinase n=1 Tax=Deinococcus aquiradiocola TaxID=393059 RepID=A0A917PAE0_9DEIO|nr:ATP-binding protein [Deinococcus aquiradiocola]GGJ68586.1 hypothetical protein GCM10008939_11280 [Deinococcus aquiradiocola]